MSNFSQTYTDTHTTYMCITRFNGVHTLDIQTDSEWEYTTPVHIYSNLYVVVYVYVSAIAI